MNSGKQLITGIVVLVAIILIFLFSPQFNIFNKSDIPENLTKEIYHIKNESGTYVSKWEINSTEQQVTIYVNCLYYKNKKYDGKNVDGWTISIVEDPEIYNETAIDSTEARVKRLMKEHPELLITYFEWDTCEREFRITVHDFTPENYKMNGEVWDGWTVVVQTLLEYHPYVP